MSCVTRIRSRLNITGIVGPRGHVAHILVCMKRSPCSSLACLHTSYSEPCFHGKSEISPLNEYHRDLLDNIEVNLLAKLTQLFKLQQLPLTKAEHALLKEIISPPEELSETDGPPSDDEDGSADTLQEEDIQEERRQQGAV